MHFFRFLALAAFWLAAPPAALAQGTAPAPAAELHGGYATINMGPTRELMQRLSAPYGSDKRSAIKEVRANAASVQPSVLYVLASQLAEDYGEDAVFWYHVGRVRAVYDVLRCRDESARVAALLDLRKLLNLELRGAMGYRRERLVRLAKKAIDWDERNPRDYDQRWPALYGKLAASQAGAAPAELMLPESEWPAILKHVHETHLKSVEDYAAGRSRKK